jgi:hypothetical protein
MTAVGRYIAAGSKRRKILREAFCLSAVARFKTLFCSFKKYSHYFGSEGQSIEFCPNNEQLYVIAGISTSIIRTRNYTPWRNRCLEQAIVARIMLNKRGIPSTVYFGLDKSNKGLKAHTWVKCGDVFVTGKTGHENYKTISFYS